MELVGLPRALRLAGSLIRFHRIGSSYIKAVALIAFVIGGSRRADRC